MQRGLVKEYKSAASTLHERMVVVIKFHKTMLVGNKLIMGSLNPVILFFVTSAISAYGNTFWEIEVIILITDVTEISFILEENKKHILRYHQMKVSTIFQYKIFLPKNFRFACSFIFVSQNACLCFSRCLRILSIATNLPSFVFFYYAINGCTMLWILFL